MQEHFIFAHVLNLYDAMMLTTTILALLLSLPLLLKRDRQQSDVLLALFLGSQGLLLLMSVMFYNVNIAPYTMALLQPFQSFPKILIPGTQGLLLLWFARSMMGKPLELSSMLTWIVIGCSVFFCMISLAAERLPHEFGIITNACHWAVSLFSVFTGVYAVKLMGEYDESLLQKYSNLDRLNLRWLRWIASGFVFVWFLHLSTSIFGTLGLFAAAEFTGIVSNVPAMFLMAAMVIYSQTHAINTRAERGETDASDEPLQVPAANPRYLKQLEDLMIRVKVYQDPELRLEGLADSMDISSRTLSGLLNRHYKKHFYDFVNHYRVLDAQDQLVNPLNRDKPIQRIFEDAGFNSKTTFNTLFKKHTGQTPSEFRKRASAKKQPPVKVP